LLFSLCVSLSLVLSLSEELRTAGGASPSVAQDSHNGVGYNLKNIAWNKDKRSLTGDLYNNEWSLQSPIDVQISLLQNNVVR